jgi:chlorite dismutase
MNILSLQRDANTYNNTQTIKNEVQATRYHVSTVETNVNHISHSTQATQQTAEKIYVQNQDIRTQLTGVGASINNATANLESYVEASVARQFERWKQEFNSGLLGMQQENQSLVGMIQTSMYQFMGEKMNAESKRHPGYICLIDPH